MTSIINRNTKDATILRQSVTQDADTGNVTKSYTTAARVSDGVPISGKCRVMQPSARERLAYAQQDIVVSDVLIFSEDPQVDNRDRITIEGRTFDVLFQRDPQEMGRIFIVNCFRSSRAVN